MSIQFAKASSQKIINTATPITAVPFTVGFWFRFTVLGAVETPWGIFDTASGNNYFELYKDGSNKMRFSTAAGGTAAAATSAVNIVAASWTYIVLRGISATNRRMAILHPTGATEHLQNTTSRTPSSLDTHALGCENYNSPDSFFGGNVAEFWLAKADIQADGAALQDWMLRQLAYGGPFSVPHLAASIVDYQSFRQGISSDRDSYGEIYSGSAGRQIWTPTNTPTMGPHPPLPYWYVKPGRAPRAVLV